jgi:hypothetical protein
MRKVRDGFDWRHGKKIAITILTDDTPAKPKDGAYARVLLKEAAEFAKATKSQQLFIWVWLQHQAWENKSRTFSVPNAALTEYGINRETKRCALLALEAAGLIALERNGKQALIVTILRGTLQKKRCVCCQVNLTGLAREPDRTAREPDKNLHVNLTGHNAEVPILR